MSTWVLGDIHGCAAELARLIELLGTDDRIVSVGDLFHRGPDPVGTARLLAEREVRFILGNHERAVLRRVGLAPDRADGSDRPPHRHDFPPLSADDLAGDGRRPLGASDPDELAFLLDFLQGHSGYYLEHVALDGAGPTSDGRAWSIVHAGVEPGVPLARTRPGSLTSLRRLARRGRPFWYEVHEGPELILFGHVSFQVPHAVHVGERLVALGLDTGCVYGGHLTAYSPERDEFRSVPAARAYARP